jgi:hypothetical protein
MDQALYPVPEGPVVGLALLDQCRQGGFPNQRKEYVADRSIGIVERRLGDAKQQSGLALDALQLADHLGSDALLGAHRDPIHLPPQDRMPTRDSTSCVAGFWEIIEASM